MVDRLKAEYISTIRETIAYLHDETACLIEAESSKYAPDSQAATEHAAYERPDTIFSGISIAGQLIEFGADHLSAFAKILVNPIELSATWTCIRSMLESCALATWLLDPDIDARGRASRVFALRYEGMEQLRKLGTAMKTPADVMAAQEAQIDAVENDALALGFAPVMTKDGKKRIGIGEQFPSTTALIRDVLDEDVNYRKLSAVAHGHHWAIRMLCYEASAENDEQIGGTYAHAFKKSISVDKIALLNLCGVRSFMRALWNQCRYLGWSTLHLEEVFENVADRLQMTPAVRFWRDYSIPGEAEGPNVS